ncbi:MAG: hypothetical protein Q9224_006719, partial [Gallowayella concinna]
QILVDAGKLEIDPSRFTYYLTGPLQSAASRGHLQVVHILLRNGAEVNSVTRIRKLDDTASSELLEEALTNLNGNRSAPVAAAMYGHKEDTVKMLLAVAGDVKLSDMEPRGFPKLYDDRTALQESHRLVPWDLRVFGVIIDIQLGVCGGAIHTAASRGYDSIVELLLDHGADPNFCDEEIPTPLQCACFNGHESTARLLIGLGADAHAVGGIGISSLHAASLGGRLAIVELLLEHGVDVNTDKSLGTPLEAALLTSFKTGRFRAVARRLVEAGAEPKTLLFEEDLTFLEVKVISKIWVDCYDTILGL